MKLDVNQIYHNYIVRIVIFALFLYKRQIRQPNVYKQSVYAFVNKRLPWKVNLVISTNKEDISKDEERDILIDELLNNIKTEFLKSVVIKFKTPLKEVEMIIDITDEGKYECFLYN